MPEESSTNTQYRIKRGDSLSKIAKRSGITLSQILAVNPQIKNPNRINVGQLITLPVQSGNGSSSNTTTTTTNTTTTTTVTPSVTSPNAPPLVVQPAAKGALPDTSNLTEAQKYDFYINYFKQRTPNLPTLSPNERLLLGLRLTSNFNIDGRRGRYDDRLVVAWIDDSGAKHVRELIYNNEPSGFYLDKDGNDANHDGKRDLGCLQDGTYKYSRAHSPKFGDILKPDADIFVRRDINRDGLIDATDDALVTNKAALDSFRTMYFHRGPEGRTGSAGCQTMRKAEFLKFWNSLGQQQHFTYILLTVA